jgi:hypothetical protein
MSNRNIRRYTKTILGVLVSIIFGLLSFVVTQDIPASILVSLMGTSISLSIEIVTSLSDLTTSIKRKDVEVVSDQRSRYQHQFLQLKLNANNTLDISGIALDNALADFIQEPVLLRKSFTGLDIRLLFLSPSGAYVSQRAQEEGIDVEELREKLRETVRRSAKIYETLLRELRKSKKGGTNLRHNIGSLEIRIFDALPYCTIFRSDDRLLFGMYLSYGKGFNLAMFEAHKDQIELRAQLDDHFNTLWRHPNTHSLVRFSHYSNEPSANFQAFKDLANLDIPSA